MKIFGDVKVLRGSAAWVKPFTIRFTPATTTSETVNAPAVPEFDEEGRLYVFRYSRTAPQQRTIERDRIFEYLKRRRLPDAGQRRIRRDLRNQAELYADLRELQTQPDVIES